MILYYHNTAIHYEKTGIGPAIILLHGFLESSTMWQNFIPYLTKNNTVVAIDLPGFGQSGIIEEVHSMELMAVIVAEILANENIVMATFIGHSMGGYVALAFVELFPEKVNRLLLLNASPLEDTPERIENRNRALTIVKNYKDAFISMAINNLFTPEEQRKHTKDIKKLKEEALQISNFGIKAAILGMRDRKNRVPILKNFAKEKIMICSDKDPIIPIDVMINLSKATDSKLYTISGGHMSWITNTQEILKFMHFIE